MLTEYLWIVVVGGIFCFTLGFGMGANDVANNFGTSVGSKSISLRKALVIAAIFEFGGSVGLGASVTDSVRKGVYDPAVFGDMPDFILTANLTSLLVVTIWLFCASSFGMSVSTTHSIIGAMMGCGLSFGFDAIHWDYIGKIVLSWIVAPLLGALVGAGLWALLRKFVLRASNPVKRAYQCLPVFLLYVCEVIVIFFMFSNPIVLNGTECEQLVDGELVSLKPCIVSKWVEGHFGLAWGIAVGIGAGMAVICYLPMRYWIKASSARRIEKMNADEAARHAAMEEARRLEEAVALAPGDNEFAVPNAEWDSVTDDGEAPVGCKARTHRMITDTLENAPWNKDLHEEVEGRNARVGELAHLTEPFDREVLVFFTSLQTMSAALACLVHGSNDVSNAAGPFASIYSIYENESFLTSVSVPIWILVLGGLSISLGLMCIGYKVIQTVGIELLHLSPPKGFVVEVSLFTVIISASYLGIPLSTTHIGIGAMIGVGLLEKHINPETGEDVSEKKFGLNWKAINWRTAKKLAYSWVLTLVLCCIVAYLIFSFAVLTPSKNSRYLGCANGWVGNQCVPDAALFLE